jgi:hypothetical protein
MCAVRWEDVLQPLTATPFARRAVETLLRRRARRRLAELDQETPLRSQTHALLGLVHRARGSRFAREHDFGRIRTISDFQRLVPLRTRRELAMEYRCAGAEPSGAWSESSGEGGRLRTSSEIAVCHRTAALTALAFLLDARPDTRLFAGRVLVLGAERPRGYLIRTHDHDPTASLVAALPAVLRPYCSILPAASADQEHRLRTLAAPGGPQVTCLAGSLDDLVRLLMRVRVLDGQGLTGKGWPALSTVLYRRCPNGAGRLALAGMVRRDGPILIEMLMTPEGALAIEDPRQRRLRLVTDHGVFLEFVPVDDLGKARPRRLTVGEVTPGELYAVAVSAPGGAWACLLDERVSFARREPPLLQSYEWAERSPTATGAEAAQPVALQLPRISGGRAIALPAFTSKRV